jgi:putative phosphonate metabolism protein
MTESWPETARFALYAAPPAGSRLAEFGARWLGRDAESGAILAPPAIGGLSAGRWRAITEDARRYAFHGTLKAPFALAAGKSFRDLVAALEDFAGARPALDVPLGLAAIAGFLALVPAKDDPALQALADACVTRFDAFRRGETPEQIARRRAGLTSRQSDLLDLWGYPYVLDQFRFHMTLTRRLDEPDMESLMPALQALAAPALAEPLRIDAICLFTQADRAASFRLLRRFALNG